MAAQPVRAAATLAVTPPACAQSYIVVTGDTLYALSQRFGVTMQLLAQVNSIVDWNKIYVAQVLCIPAAGGPVTTTTPTVTVSAPATPTVTATPAPVFVGIPVFSIITVKRNESITIQASHFPANTKFDVTMGAFGTLGVGGTAITSTLSGTGAFTATYKIPAAWANAEKLSIRLQSAAGYYSYNWFWNFSTP
jgi:LysM repeat protein